MRRRAVQLSKRREQNRFVDDDVVIVDDDVIVVVDYVVVVVVVAYVMYKHCDKVRFVSQIHYVHNCSARYQIASLHSRFNSPNI